MRALLYCTKSAPYLIKSMGGRYLLSSIYDTHILYMYGNYYNGKIVTEIEFEIAEIKRQYFDNKGYYICDYDLKDTCLTYDELDKYLKGWNGYAIKITHLILNWRPKELSEYYIKKRIRDKKYFVETTKAPQNMCYVYNSLGRRYVLISIRPEWLCKILNREKTIEVRKAILKEMIDDDR